jgi:[methyl-Co(III) methanol-specific corrinoid protein]:coenzyme M methyltransferase
MAAYSNWERFQDALRGRPKDRVPVFAGTTLWAASNFPDASFQEIASDPGLIVKAQLWAREEIGIDVLYPSADPLFIAEAFGCRIRFLETGPRVDPLPISVDRVEDVEELPFPDPRETGRLPVVLEACRILSEKTHGKIPLLGLFEGAFTSTCRIFETERVLRMIYKRPTVLSALLERVNEFLIGFGKALIESGVNAFYVPEPTASSTMISPRMFSQIVLPRCSQPVWTAPSFFTYAATLNPSYLPWERAGPRSSAWISAWTFRSQESWYPTKSWPGMWTP